MPQTSGTFASAPAAALLALALLAACSRAPAPAADPAGAPTEEAVVNFFNWEEYIEPQVLADFTRETGIRVNYDTFPSNEVLETKLLTGRSGYDVVVITATFMENQIRAGVYRRLEPALLPNRRNLDPELAATLAPAGTEGHYSVPYHCGAALARS